MQALADGQLTTNTKLLSHIDNCLGCRSCERVCPSGVKYGELLDASHSLLQADTRSLLQTLGLKLLGQPRWLNLFAQLMRVYQISGMQTLLRRSGALKLTGMSRIERLLPALAPALHLKTFYPANTTTARGNVALFSGCISKVADQVTLQAAITLLTRLGYNVHIPTQQTCCGAMHVHAGERQHALSLAQQNLAAFAQAEYEAILFNASGCGAVLTEYQTLDWPQAQRQQMKQFVHKSKDISQFLNEIDWPAELALKPLAKRIGVHEPCTARNVLRNQTNVYQLLTKIPAADIQPLGGNERCCGAAGSYMLRHPQMADALKADKLQHIAQLQSDIVVTSNIGCSLHLMSGLSTQQHPTKLVHPIVLLAQQLEA